MTESKAAYRYTGKGDYHNGIPARNLTEADVAALDKPERDLLVISPIYKAVGEDKPAKAEPPAKDAGKE